MVFLKIAQEKKAGIKGGDLILRLDKFNLNTIYDYMGALGSLKKGKPLRPRYKR
jgi:S1-C subfamily serine protease